MKYILITGVSSGIGYATVRFLIDKGYYIFGSVRRKEDKVKLESDFPRNFTCLRFDVTQKEEVVAAFDRVKPVLNGNHLFGLVNNAGRSVGGPTTRPVYFAAPEYMADDLGLRPMRRLTE